MDFTLVITDELVCHKTRINETLLNLYNATPPGKPTPNWMVLAPGAHPNGLPIDIDADGRVVIYDNDLKEDITDLRAKGRRILVDASAGQPQSSIIPPMPNSMCPCDTDDGT